MTQAEGKSLQSTLTYIALFLLGGAFTGVGILQLYFSFGFAQGPFNRNITSVGFTAIDNIGAYEAADHSIPFVVLGVLCLVIANATAWRYTDGY